MANRTDLSATLHGIANNVYFNPPIKMSYPCIKYELSRKRPIYANNKKYINRTAYTITVIDSNPESTIAEAVEDLPYCSFDRKYVADGLSHFVYTIFI